MVCVSWGGCMYILELLVHMHDNSDSDSQVCQLCARYLLGVP